MLPGGLVDAQGVVHREVELVPLRGRDELLFATEQGELRHDRITELLVRCVRSIGAVSPVSRNHLRSLPVADRQYLLLKLREATFGDRFEGTVACASRACRARIDIDFPLGAIPIKESSDKGPLYSMQLSSAACAASALAGGDAEVVFRLPNGSDQEAIEGMLQHDERSAAAALLARCVQRVGPRQSPGAAGIARLSARALMEIEQRIEEVAPAVELTAAGDCPECGAGFAIPLDLTGLFWSECRISRARLLREVHYLAFHYHWSEREIMAMPRSLRREYIGILAEEVTRLNGDA